MVIFSLLITLYSILQSSGMQTMLARLGADYLSKKLNTEVRIRGFGLSFKKGLIIEDILVKDIRDTTLFSARELSVSLGKVSLRKHILRVNRVLIDQGIVQLITHKGDSTLNLQYIINFFSSGDTIPDTDTTPGPKWDFSVGAVRLINTRFHLQDANEPAQEVGMNFQNIDVSAINLDLNDFRIEGDTMLASISRLSARERSGIMVKSMSGEFAVSEKFLKAHNLKLVTNNSDLALTFDFLYEGWISYNDFLDKVTIHAKIEPSYLDLSDIGFFAPELLVMKDRLRLSGDIRGTVSNFKARNFMFAFGNNTLFNGSIAAVGLPDVEETFVDMNIKALTATREDIEAVLIPGDMRNIELPAMLGNTGLVALKGTFTGFYNDFVARVNVRSAIGSVSTDLTLRKLKGLKGYSYNGQMDVGAFDIGRLVGDTALLGKVTARADISGSGLSADNANLAMNIRIDSILLNRYNYRNLQVKGALDEKKFTGDLVVDDPNVRLDFSGLVDFNDSLPSFDFSALIHKAQLFTLNLLTRDSLMDISTSMKVDFTGTGLDNIDGSIKFDNTVYSEGTRVITMDHFSLLTTQDEKGGKSYRLTSDFVDADVSGEFHFSELVPSLVAFVNDYLASFSLRDSLVNIRPLTNQRMNYEIRFKETDELTEVFIPLIRIAKGSSLYGAYDEEKGSLTLRGNSPTIHVNGFELADWHIAAETRRDNLQIITGCNRFFLKKASKSDSLEVAVDSVKLAANLHHDSIAFDLGWTDLVNPSVIGGFVSFTNSPAVEIKFDEFAVFIENRRWEIDRENYLSIDSSSVRVHRFGLSAGDQILRLDGMISHNPMDTLDIEMRAVDISRLDMFLGKGVADVDGILGGRARITGIYDDLTLLSDLRIDRFRFNKEDLGDVTFNLRYDDVLSKFDVKAQILYTGNAGTNIPFLLEGSYFAHAENPNFDFDLKLKNLNLKMLNPFVSSFMTGLTGLASGQVKITGNPEKPNVSGELKLMRTEFRISYLNVPYSLADVVKIDSNAFIFNNIALYDSLGHKAILNGRITHQHFSDLRLGLNIALEDFSAFRNTRAQNSIFYGKARGSGTVSITGPIDDISINVKAKTGGDTKVTIPISMTESVGQNDFIIFDVPETDSLGVPVPKPVVQSTGLNLNLAIQVMEDAEAEVFFPDQLGNVKASGTGNLLMGMTPTTPFTLSGIFTISKGSFLFQLRNILRLPMSVTAGSTISWKGDPADANIAMTAVYKTKTSLKGITTDPDEMGIRIPVECLIRLSGKLMNPEVSFGIRLPNVEEEIKTKVFAAIDTNNPTVMTEQTIYLLVMNQFKPVVASSSGVDVSSASFSLVTNQLNSWLSQVSNNVNVNVNYSPATTDTQQEIDVGISTQLLDDRLLIDGTFGMNSYSNADAQQSSTIVGDINIEYILTKNRRWRVHAYNRTNTLSILNNNSPYTQGVGLTYQRDFTNLRELFKPKKKPKTN